MAGIGLKNADRCMKRFNNIANMELKGVINKATTLVHGQAKALAPVGITSDLGESIHMSVTETEGRVYTNVEYAPFVEFGTGIKGNGSYPYEIKGLSLEYRSSPWYIPASELEAETAERYHFPKVYGKDGAEYYVCYGQEAQPFMYPALKNNEKTIRKMIQDAINIKLKENSENSGGE